MPAKYVLSPMSIDPALGAQLERAAGILSVVRGRRISVPQATREMMAAGLAAFFARPDVVALLAEHDAARVTTEPPSP